MSPRFLSVKDDNFIYGGSPIRLKGYGLGNWLNLEHFMLGVPGTDSQIRAAIKSAYGSELAAHFWDAFYRDVISEDDFSFMKKMGVNSVRIPFNYRLFESDLNPFEYTDSGFEQLDRVIDLCSQFDILAILDLHAVPGGQNPDWHGDNTIGECLFWEYAHFQQRVRRLWVHIARRYADNPAVAAYDLLNEPAFYQHNGEPVHRFYNDLINDIRTVDTNHTIIMEGDFYAHRFDSFSAPDDDNCAYSIHHYPFFSIENYAGRDCIKAIYQGLESDSHLADFRQRIGRPLWCGETGVPCTRGKIAEHEKLLDDTLTLYDSENISWSIWCYKDARSMGTLRPSEDAPWMAFSRKACAGWEFWKEFDEPNSRLDALEQQYGYRADEPLRRRLNFRKLADTQYFLAHRLISLLKDIPFESFLAGTESFAFSNCEIWQPLQRVIASHCVKGDGA